MKIIHKDLKKGEVKVKVENNEDMWYLSQIIDPGDLVSGKTERKIKIGAGEEGRKTKATRKIVFIEVKAEKVDFGEDSLRVNGVIVNGPEDVPRGEHHSFSIGLGAANSTITIKKEKWLSFQVDKLREASEETKSKILIVVLERDSASIALMKRYGYKMLTELKGEVEKKGAEVKTSDFYQEIIEIVKEYVKRYEIENIIVASPAFWKEEFVKKIKEPELKKMVVQATCNNTGENGVNEVLKRPELRQVLHKDRIAKEMNAVEELLAEVSKKGKYVYGAKETKEAAEMGAVETLLVTDRLIKKYREDENYELIDNTMKAVDNAKGKIMLISSEHDGGKKLDGLGGVGAVLRFRIS